MCDEATDAGAEQQEERPCTPARRQPLAEHARAHGPSTTAIPALTRGCPAQVVCSISARPGSSRLARSSHRKRQPQEAHLHAQGDCHEDSGTGQGSGSQSNATAVVLPVA
eukprot:763006-Hanusia_phi.AAC.1